MKACRITIVLACVVFGAVAASAATLQVGGDGENAFPTIQGAADAAADGDAVVVADGVYSGPGNIEIDLKGKRITLRSAGGFERCAIDCGGAGRAFHFISGETQATVIDGFTIRNGYSSNDGGGILCTSGGPTISNTAVVECTAIGDGGGIAVTEGSPRIINCIIARNSARGSGGGVSAKKGDTIIVNCTIVSNTARSGGGACIDAGTAHIANAILWENGARSGEQLALGAEASVSVGSSVVKGDKPAVAAPEGARLSWSHDNFDVYPCFALEGDYRLLGHSPCVDTGNDSPHGGRLERDPDGNPRITDGDGNGKARIDMGAFERNAQRPAIALSKAGVRLTAAGGKARGTALQVRNAGGRTLQWQISGECPWLKTLPAAGQSMTDANEISLDVDAAGLKHGKHTCRLTVAAENAANSPRFIDVTLIISGTLRVPDHFATIQAAIDAAIDGDEIVIADGVYTGEGNREIDYRGKAITLRSENGPEKCIIDCEGEARGFIFRSNETRDAVLEGITLRNGHVAPTWPQLALGGGITCQGASPTIVRNIITANFGSGIYCTGAAAPDIRSNMIVKNVADWGGCGIYADTGAAPVIINNTIADNPGGGIRAWGSTATIVNCIIWGNGEDLGGPTPRNCCIPGIAEGNGNISAYPYFIDPLNGDYRIETYSPCIDAGDESVVEPGMRDIDGHPRAIYRSADIGADEKTYISTDLEDNLGDGLPDDWERKHFGTTDTGPWDDPDNDQRTNRDEYLMGTDPKRDQQRIYVSAANANDPSANGSREHPFPTIQQGVDAATAAVYVCAGTYRERVTVHGKTLDIYGGFDDRFARCEPAKNLTIIDAGGLYRGVTFVNSEGGLLSGFTITGGNAYHGGGVCCALSSTRIAGNIITGNSATCGGAIECGWQSAPVIENNVIVNNTARKFGGGIYAWGEAKAAITNNTISGNTAAESGGAICCASQAAATVENCILWGNGEKVSEVALQAPSILNIGYSVLTRGKNGISVEEESTLQWLKGNSNKDPLLADPARGNFHLKSQYGRWTPGDVWVKDDATSPCIDAGGEQADYSNEPEPNGRRINIGAFGNTEWASKSKE